MSAFKNDDDFKERLTTAAKAKQALLEKFRARPKADDPAAAERHAARLATSLARDARIAERKVAREAEAARLQAELVRLQAEAVHQAAEEVARKATAEAEQAAQKVTLEAERKAARDARYAGRKARQRQR